MDIDDLREFADRLEREKELVADLIAAARRVIEAKGVSLLGLPRHGRLHGTFDELEAAIVSIDKFSQGESEDDE